MSEIESGCARGSFVSRLFLEHEPPPPATRLSAKEERNAEQISYTLR